MPCFAVTIADARSCCLIKDLDSDFDLFTCCSDVTFVALYVALYIVHVLDLILGR